MAKDKVKWQDEKLQVVDPQDLFNRLISLALVLTSGGGDGLPISLTKIMGYELSQFPASLFETEYLGGSNPDYARDRPNFACRAWARMVKNGQKCFFPERSFLNSLKCVWLPFNYIASYIYDVMKEHLGCSFMS